MTVRGRSDASLDGNGFRAWAWSAAAVGAILGVARYRQRKRRERRPVFRDKLALVTGSSRGLGYLLARELSREGARVVLCARDATELERARRALAAEGIEVRVEVCDVSDRGRVEALVKQIENQEGRLDVLVNNAGIVSVGPIETMTVEDFEASLGVMFWGVVYPTFAVLPGMLARRSGRIVNITSIGGRIGVPHLSSYCAAKFAALGFSEGLRAELAPKGVSVTSVVPGLMRTGGHVNALFKGAHEDEYRWFSLGASLPVISMDAERAARQILLAVKRGDAEYVVGFPAKLAELIHGVFPGLTADAASAVNRLLPERVPATQKVPGRELERNRSWIWRAVTSLGRESVDRFQDHRKEPVPRSLPVSYP